MNQCEWSLTCVGTERYVDVLYCSPWPLYFIGTIRTYGALHETGTGKVRQQDLRLPVSRPGEQVARQTRNNVTENSHVPLQASSTTLIH